MLTLRLTKTAQTHLEDIWVYTCLAWSPDQADKYIDLLEKGFFEILKNPCIGKARPEIKNGYRAFQVEKHLVFYHVEEEFINIIDVLHIRMDVKNYL